MKKQSSLMFCGLLIASANQTSRADNAKPPPALSLKCVESWNRHDHGNTGASGVRLESAVTLRFLTDGQVRIEDQGSREDSDLFGNIYHAKKSQWSQVWLGTFKTQENLMVLELERTKRECAIVATERNNADGTSTDKKTPCTDSLQKLRLECQTARLTVDAELASPNQGKQPQNVWSCSASGGQAVGIGTPTPWVFGKTACIETVNGIRGAGRIYRLCSAAAATIGGAR